MKISLVHLNEHAIFCAIKNGIIYTILVYLYFSQVFNFQIDNRYALWVIIYLIDFQLLWIMYK